MAIVGHCAFCGDPYEPLHNCASVRLDSLEGFRLNTSDDSEMQLQHVADCGGDWSLDETISLSQLMQDYVMPHLYERHRQEGSS